MSLRAALNPLRNAAKNTLARNANKSSVRNMSGGGSIEEEIAEYQKWRTVTYVAVPACGALAVYLLSQSHAHHEPKNEAMSHIAIRHKRFPWPKGDVALFDDIL